MRKNGFTLIELLAVIVILAIIALIATPIILGIINDAREKANERSVELYASAVRNGIAAYQLREGKEVLPGIYNETNKLPFEVEYDGKVDCENVIISEDGKISLDKCTVNGGTKEYSYGIEEETPSLVGTMGICNPISVATEGTYTAGDKYECDVDPNKEGYDHTFYVLNITSESVNLIMDRNICEDGTEATASNTCKYAWITRTDYDIAKKETTGGSNNNLNSFGPVTAMAKLNAATSKWDNVLSLNTTYNDEGNHFTNFALTGKARLPRKDEITSYSASANNAYLYDNLQEEYYCYDNEDDYNEVSCDEAGYIEGIYDDSITHINNIYGYWTLSSYASISNFAWYVDYVGYAGHDESVFDIGVRPVINLSI